MSEAARTVGSRTSAPAADDLVEVRIRGLMMDPVTNMPMVVLKDVAEEQVLPIWVGIFEANAIALEIEKNSPPRPMTHDLIRNILRSMEIRVTRVVISDLKDDTFFAVIWMERAGEVLSIDSRPSDAIALAMRADCPVYVSRHVMEMARAGQSGNREAGSADELRRWLEGLGDDDMGQYKM